MMKGEKEKKKRKSRNDETKKVRNLKFMGYFL